MALGFNRKKTEAGDESAAPANSPVPAPSAPATPAPAADFGAFDEAFDLDAFSAIAPSVTPAETASPAMSVSAFDLPETPETISSFAGTTSSTNASAINANEDPLDFDQLFEIEQRNAAPNNQAPAPFVPASATITEPAAPFFEPQTPVAVSSETPKKKLPLVPILGALAVLGLAGAGAKFFAGQDASEEDETAPILTKRKIPNVVPVSTSAPRAVAPAVAPKTSISTAPANVDTASPGIAPVSVSAAQLVQMKTLWKRGADAKHRGDYASARRLWNQGLKIQPTNTGFRESIAKLPR